MMQSHTIQECEPSITEREAKDFLASHWKHLGQPEINEPLVYCSWPEQFGSSAGPFNGVGCQVMTLFRMEAWLGVYTNTAVIFCGGKVTHVGDLNITARII